MLRDLFWFTDHAPSVNINEWLPWNWAYGVTHSREILALAAIRSQRVM